MTLLDRDFPSDLLTACISLSGETTAVKSVRSALRILFDIKKKYQQQEYELKVTREKLFRLQRAVQAVTDARSSVDDALEFAKSDDGFFLESETGSAAFWKGHCNGKL